MLKPKVTVVLPAYNAEKTLERTLKDIPRDIVSRIILVDDRSKDGTVELAKKLNIEVFVHEKNGGYGANQKTCYKLALEDKPDIIIMIHPDYQYDPRVIKYLVGFIDEGYCDVMLGSRIRSKKEVLENGMPYYKYIANRILSTFESFVSGYVLSDWHSGMRAYKREVLENIPFQKNANDFVFDSQVLFQIIEKKYRIAEIPVPVRYFEEASSIDFLSSIKYGLLTLSVVFKFLFRKIFK